MPVSQDSNFSEERLLVSVLFADIVGFSAMADQLEPEIVGGLMRDLWTQMDPIIEEYGGYIDKQLGDSIVVVWGVPETIEDDSERAVTAGLELLVGLEKFKQDCEYCQTFGRNC